MKKFGLFLSFCFVLIFVSCEGKSQKVSSFQTDDSKIETKIDITDSLQYLVREAKGKEKPILVILMHGFGANKEDLFPLANYFPENYIVVTPQAPYKIGNSNYQWYTSEKDAKGNPNGKTDELSESINKMENFIVALQKKYKVSADKTFIGGFSQGANMSYQIGLRNPNIIKGIGVLSGTIFNDLKDLKENEKPSKLKIFIGHGDLDNRIPYSQAKSSKTWLDAHNYSAEFHTYEGMSHSISEEEIKDLVDFVQKNLL